MCSIPQASERRWLARTQWPAFLAPGFSLLKPVILLWEGARNLIEAMSQAGLRRFVCVTGLGAGDSRGHGGFLYDRIIRPLILGQVYRDKDRQEAVVRASGLD